MRKKVKTGNNYDPSKELSKGAKLTAASSDKTQGIEVNSAMVTVGGKTGTVEIFRIANGREGASINGTLRIWLSMFRYKRPDGTTNHVAGWKMLLPLAAGQTAIESAVNFVIRINSGARPYKAAASGGRDKAELAIVFTEKQLLSDTFPKAGG